jgi:catabolite repression protein CreC
MAATMENESTFVAPEGVYTVTEQLKPSLAHIHPPNTPHVFPTKLSFIVIPFPAPKQAGPGLAQLLGGNKENKREKEKEREKEREKEKLGQKDDGVSLSSSDTPDDGHTPADQAVPMTEGTATNSTIPTLFSQTPSKKKPTSRPKHNMRTTSSTFITRIQTAEGLTKILQSKHGETTFLFYNIAKNFCWVDTASKSKVAIPF